MKLDLDEIKRLFRSRTPPEPEFYIETADRDIPVYVIEFPLFEVAIFTDELEVGDD